MTKFPFKLFNNLERFRNVLGWIICQLNFFYDDFKIDSKFESPEKAVLQEDIRKFAKLTGDFNRLHLDKEFAKSTIFRRPIAHGMLIVSFALGLWYSMDLTRESIIAFLGINNLTFKLPVYAGDRVRLVSTVISARESRKRKEAGIVSFNDEVRNSESEIVSSFERTLLLKKRPRQR